jgi:hypothetical protein
MNRHFKLQIKTLENAPRRDAVKLQESKKQKKGKNQQNSPYRRLKISARRDGLLALIPW